MVKQESLWVDSQRGHLTYSRPDLQLQQEENVLADVQAIGFKPILVPLTVLGHVPCLLTLP